MKCNYKHCVNVLPDGKRKFCCIKCKNNHNAQLGRTRLKQKAIAYKGTKCAHCGYNKSVWALVFHHLDPTKKDFSIGGDGSTKAWSRIQVELDKCILLCMNCHAEEHEKLSLNQV